MTAAVLFVGVEAGLPYSLPWRTVVDHMGVFSRPRWSAPE